MKQCTQQSLNNLLGPDFLPNHQHQQQIFLVIEMELMPIELENHINSHHNSKLKQIMIRAKIRKN